MNRRSFLKVGGLTAAGAVALSLTGVSVAPNAWSMTLSNLDLKTGETLSKFCRTLFPHKHLKDMYYDACVEGLDAKIKSDKSFMNLLQDGVEQLNSLKDKSFLSLSDSDRLAVARQIEGSPFFNAIKGHLIVALYNNEEIWMSFGYEGPSFPHGGYLHRGFNDINWLPRNGG